MAVVILFEDRGVDGHGGGEEGGYHDVCQENRDLLLAVEGRPALPYP